MNSPDLLTDLSGVSDALSKIDGNLQKAEAKAASNVFPDEPRGDLTVCGLLLLNNLEHDTTGE